MSATACDSYTWALDSNVYTTSGVYTNTSINAAGCTHIDSLVLNINSSTSSIMSVIACDSYTWIDGNTYTTSTSFTTPSHYVINTQGVTFSPSSLTINIGDTVTWNNTGGFHNVNGMQSVFPNNPEGFGNSVSNTAWSYQWVFTIAGTYDYQCDPHATIGMNGTISVLPLPSPPPTFTTTNLLGCDSVISLLLTINNSSSSSANVTACDSYTWAVDSNVYTTSGVYTNTSTNAAGCTHIDSLVLTINSSTSSLMSVASCNNYIWSIDGNTYAASGIYTSTSINATGCAHVDSLDLTINAPDGCTDPTAVNYDSTALCDDGSCIPVVLGCTDPLAWNYSPPSTGVNTDDGSCVYQGCIDSTACNYNPVATIPDLCTYPALGFDCFGNCLAPTAPITLCWETAIFDTSSCNWVVSGNQPVQPTLLCWETAIFDTLSCSWIVSGTQPAAPTNLACYETATFNTSTCIWDISGTQPAQPTLACWEVASWDSSLCVWLVSVSSVSIPNCMGCTDSTASNYDPTAIYNDSTCTYGLLCLQDGDANCDNMVDLTDLFLVLNHWLTNQPVGTNGDVIGSEDGFVDLTDLFLVLNNWLQSTTPMTGPSSAQLLRAAPSQSSFVGLSLEIVDNSLSTFSNGEVTYRLYAKLNSSAAKLFALFGDESNPHMISTTGTFYQDPNASDFQHMINPALIGASIPGFENIGFDSWLTIGDNYTPSNNVSSIGELNWPTFSGSDWLVGGVINSDAAIYRVPTDVECLPDNNKVLLGQFTTEGTLSGYINLTGLNPDGSAWTETNIPIPSVQSPNSVNEDQIGEINIYPNPNMGVFNVEFSSLTTQDVTIRVVNALGETVFIDIIKHHKGVHGMSIDMSDAAKGIYFLQLEMVDRLINKKIKLN
jgi:plastocyanin